MQTANQPETFPAKRMVLVDGSGYIFRAYHALPPLTRPDGTPIGAVVGFTNMLLSLRDTMPADYLAVIFDVSRITFRNTIYPEYKAHRPPPPEDLVPQFALVREATRALNIPVIEMADYEADDLLAAYAKAGRAEGMDVVIVSSDKDLMQLIAGGITLYDPMKQKTMGPEQVMEKFGVLPEQVVQVQALIGDSVDNVPGVPGIGPKTAAELINTYGSLEALLARVDEIKQPKRRESLIHYAQQARISLELVQLKDDMPLPVPLPELAAQSIAPDTLLSFLREQGFKALLKKIETRYGATTASASAVAAPPPAASHIATTYECVTTLEALRRWIGYVQQAGRVAIDTETTSLDAVQAKLVGISLSTEAGKACYIPLGHVKEVTASASQGNLFGDDAAGEQTTRLEPLPGQLSQTEVLRELSALLNNPAIIKIGQNIKYDMQVLHQQGAELSPVHDTMLMSYVLGAGLHAHNMDDMAMRLLGHQTTTFASLVGSGKSQIGFAQVPLEPACHYAAEDADITLRLFDVLQPQLRQQKLLSVYEQIERPLLPVIMAMEAVGIRVDKEKLASLSEEFAVQLAVLEKEIYAIAGHPFNIGSPKQLGEVLFDEMGLGGGKKSSKTGAYATGADVLEELAEAGLPLPGKVLEWRQLAKLKSTYSDALAEKINPATGRIHTSFSLTGASTGRLASSDPNLQNIPIRTREGKRIREAFIAAPGCRLISADYSQIELRLLAHMANIDTLKQAFANGIDIHTATASQMFGVPTAEVNSDLRRSAKTINFGIIYGISAHGLAARLGISRSEAADYIATYFAQYPGIKAYMEECKATAHAQGYVETLYGRRVHLKDINAANPNLRAFSERAAINAPLQGTAADIIKKAMVSVHRMLAKDFPEAKLLLQVHDELIVEAPETIAAEVAEHVKRCMRDVAALSVPLEVEAGVGMNWGEVH